MTFYRTDAEYLLDELKKLDLLIRLYILKSKLGCEGGDPFAGLYISEDEVAALLDEEAPPEDPRIQSLAGNAEGMEESIELKAEESREEGVILRLPRLVRAFDLSEFERGAVIICAAPELDAKYERLYAYLQDDLTKKRPTVGLIQTLLSDDPKERIMTWRFFAPTRTLFKRRILEFSEGNGPSLSSTVRIDPGVLAYILGDETRPERTRVQADHPFEDLFSEKLSSRLENLVRHLQRSESGKIINIGGPQGAGKGAASEFICRELGLSLHSIDLAALAVREEEFEASLARSFRDAILRGSALYLEGLDLLDVDSKDGRRRAALLRSLEDFPGLVFIATPSSQDLALDEGWHMDLFRLEVPRQDYTMRKRIWDGHLRDRLGEGDGGRAAEELAGELASKFRFTAGTIDEAVTAAQNLAVQEGREEISLEDVYEGCRSQSNRRLSSLARRIDPRY
ncbi:MAG: hypothetical protein JW724_02805, partial [Candidatus Altiarchaeota archaeon]|nr:hypothetical protein [Candidatus Altiarchaeota archaeon]